MNKMSKRLEILASLVDKKIIADVGCDHGKLVKYLLENNKVNFAFVSDISAKSLNKAEILLSKYNQVKAICCDGLSGYVGENVEQCIISGMGGDEIIKIISTSPIKIKSFILSPQHNIIDVKRFMLENYYKISFDIIVKDKDKFYTIIKCDKTDKKQELNEMNLYFGKDNFENNSSDIDEYIDLELDKLKKIQANMCNENNDISHKINIFEQAKKERNYE